MGNYLAREHFIMVAKFCFDFLKVGKNPRLD